MAKKISDYINELQTMIEQRTGKPCEIWLNPQIRAAAMNLVMLDKLQAEIDTAAATFSLPGSNGQQKIVANPLFEQYDKMQRTLLNQYAALGLNYKTALGKVGDAPAKEKEEEEDPVLGLLRRR